ncbi:MAG: hypothetical protein JJU24_06680 [Natronohydrobacter sp.]|nr:hypothetical protein [Natronohydrobacter sp.]
MLTFEEIVRCINAERGEVSIEKEHLVDAELSADKIADATGRTYSIESFILPNPQGGLAIPSEIVRFVKK